MWTGETFVTTTQPIDRLRSHGWVLVPSALDEQLRLLLVEAIEQAHTTLRKIQIANGVGEGTDGTVHHLPLVGEDAVPVTNDCVDLTPFLREDILLTLPQHPLCKPDCRGLSQFAAGGASGQTSQTNAGASAWAALNKLKLNK